MSCLQSNTIRRKYAVRIISNKNCFGFLTVPDPGPTPAPASTKTTAKKAISSIYFEQKQRTVLYFYMHILSCNMENPTAI